MKPRPGKADLLPPLPKVKIPWKTLSPLQRKRLRSNPRLYGIPEFESWKANCRNLTPQAAIAEAAYLSNQYRDHYRSDLPVVDLYEIIRTLNSKKIPFVLTGVYGMSSWTGRPRATRDVDVLVKGGRTFARTVNELKKLYPMLETHAGPGVTGFFPPGEKESLIDVIYPHREDLARTIETSIWIKESGLSFRIPTLEAALANKYEAMLNLARDTIKRALDAVDFATMVKLSLDPGRARINLETLSSIGDLGWDGGGKELLRLVEEAKKGKVPAICQ